MGWSFRRSVKFGPVRLNFSKSGVGASIGIKGLRLGTGPRGTRLTVSGGGIQYRKQIGSARRPASAQGVASPVAAPEAPGLGTSIVSVLLLIGMMKCVCTSISSGDAKAPALTASVPVQAPAAAALAPPKPKPAPKARGATAKRQKPAWLKAVKAVPPPEPKDD